MRFDQKGVKEDGTVKHFHTIHIFHAKKKIMGEGSLLGSAILFAPFQTAFS